MGTHHEQPGSDDSQPVLVEVARPAGVAIGKRLWLVDGDGQRAVFLGATAIHVYAVADRDAERVCMASLSTAGLAFDVEIAEAFGVHRNTVGRLARQLEQHGIAGVVAAKRGPKGPHKVTGEVEAVIDGGLAAGLGPAEVTRQVADQTGVNLSREHVRQLMAARRTPPADQLTLVEDEPAEHGQHGVTGHDDGDCGEHEDGRVVVPAVDGQAVSGEDVGAVSGEDVEAVSGEDVGADSEAGDGVHDGGVPGGAGGVGFDPPVVLPEGVVGDYMGLSLLYPAVEALGLVEVAREQFRLPRSERFGVRGVVLTLLFLTLLGKPTVEAAKHLRRAAFGAVVGTGRAPAVKTLRRKLAEMAAQGRAGTFGTALSRRWVKRGIIDTAYLYVDGHVQAYTGKRRLEKVWSTKRRMPLPGIHTYHVGDITGRPLLFVTEQVSSNLAKAMPTIVEAIRETIGDRNFTIIFDRGGYDSKLFTWLDEQGIGFITYQRGDPDLPKAAFTRRETRFEGKRLRMHIAEDEVTISGAGPWRRVVVRTRDGHQTPILTNLTSGKAGPARLACLMFARWRQENVFKYMGEHHGLDQLVSYACDPADPDTLVVNPQRTRLDRDIATRRRELAKLKAKLGDALLDEPRDGSRTSHGLKIAQKGAVKQIRDLEDDIAALVAERKPLPKHVTVSELDQPRDIMRLEHKHIVDRIKICAYNAEQWLLDRLVEHYPNRHDVRDLLRAFTRLPGRIDTTDTGIHITLDAPDTPAHRRALADLIDELNTHHVVYPGTDIPVTYHLAMHHSETAA